MIFTFYSYKGGVGRSMALANLAHWLYLRGLKVLMVDWDLEAPGLEAFFYGSHEELERVRSHLGVIDLLNAYRRHMPYPSAKSDFSDLTPLDSFLCEVKPHVSYAPGVTQSGGRLRLLTAGWRSGERFAEYAESVQAFDWTEFYARYRGEEYFNWLHGQLLEAGEVVLIDSRTGVSEMSGVCTRQLADVVVAFCAPNAQNLRGTLDMAESFVSAELKRARGGRSLELVILPARVDDADSKGHDEFRHQFHSQVEVERYTPKVFGEWKRTPWHLEIPYKAQYSYGESLITGVSGANEKLEEAYKRLAAHLALFAPEGSPLWLACEPELKVLATLAGKEFGMPAWRAAEAALARFTPEEVEAARLMLLRMVYLSPKSSDLDSPSRASLEEFHSPDRLAVLERLSAAGIVSRVEGTDSSSESYALAHDSLAKSWPRLREWIKQQRGFLVWRQDLALQARKWRDAGRDPAFLLRGAPLEEASRNAAELPGELNAAEKEFVGQSVSADEVQKMAESQRDERERQALLQAELERRKKRGRRLVAYYGVAASLAVAVLGWSFWLASDDYQIRQVVAQGMQLEATREVSTRAWRTALLVSGYVEEVLVILRQIQAGPERAGALADAAVLLHASGNAADAPRVAAEALKLPVSGLKPEDYANSLAQVLARLLRGGLALPSNGVQTLTDVLSQLDDPAARVRALEWLLPLPDSTFRTQYLDAAREVRDPARQSQVYTNLSYAAQTSDPELASAAADRGVQAAAGTGDSSLQASAATAAAVVRPTPERWEQALQASRAVSAPLAKVHALAALARGLGRQDRPSADRVWKEALAAAESLSGTERVLAMVALAASAQGDATDTAGEARERARQGALEIKAEPDRMQFISLVAGLYAGAGEFTVVTRLSNELPDPAARAQLFAQIAIQAGYLGRKDDAQRAAAAMLEASQNTVNREMVSGYLLAMIPILYPAPSAEVIAMESKIPQGWLQLAASAQAAGDESRARTYRETAQRLADEIEPTETKSEALAAVAKAYARSGELRQARTLADRCEVPDDRLEAYAAIILADAAKSRPELSGIPEVARLN